MLFFYTGASKPNTQQNVADLSLGGFVSNTPLPNNNIGNLFSEVSKKALENTPSVETKAFVIQNETTTTTAPIILGYTYPAGANFKIEVAVVTLTNNFTTMEKIASMRDTPYYATFQEANVDPTIPVNNSINLGTLAAGAALGIWVRRTILFDNSKIISCPTFLPTS